MAEQLKHQKSKFQLQLEKEAIKNLLVLVTVGCACFSIAIFGVNLLNAKLNAERHLEAMNHTVESVYESVQGYLDDEANRSILVRAVTERQGGREVQYSLNRYNVSAPTTLEIILSDADNRVVFTSLAQEALNPHRLAFNRIVSDNALRGGEGIYNTVYYFSGTRSEYVFAMPLYQDGKLCGFVQLYLDSAGWAQLLDNYQYDAIITAQNGAVIYCSSARFLPERSSNRFRGNQNTHMISLRGVRYLVSSRSLRERGIILYSFIYYPKNYLYVGIGVLIIILLGGVWFSLSLRMSGDMAAKNARSVNLLVDEMRIINHGDSGHIIVLDTGDEFEEIANRINGMVRSLGELHGRNTELIRLNSSIEMRNLQAQLNPHFIYNTLETIKFLIFSAPDKSAHLIETFTHILRYSINNTKQDVLLREDMIYINDYLYIQSTRFADRFICTTDIEEQCYGCMVPKLLLQPLVENSIKYGFMGRMEVTVRIRGWMEEGYLMLTVEDNGMGVSAPELEILRRIISDSGVETEHNGLQNVARRIALQYEADSRLTIDSVSGQHFRVNIKLYAKGGKSCTPQLL
ncbi:histidine kinase [Hydrogenoanaerobacterium sp.]|uniref:sensor histidine kinase n=1 Tax=Hydrogenoanaerobacterium sp. TaxID=2953763 RepID=UPI0028987E42|nr:histidine kinase [Hydrogenoanaerobacterium sp.]